MKKIIRGEEVEIVREAVAYEDRRNSRVLGGSVHEASTLVRYPDGELGYVKPNELREVSGDGTED